MSASVVIKDGTITQLLRVEERMFESGIDVDMSGYLLMPGLINAHDHLQYALHPRIGRPPYANYVDWGADIHVTCAFEIAKYKSVPRDVRLWWGGIRNLLCGVTTVCHHDAFWTRLHDQTFPVHVVSRYGWAHSLSSGGDLQAAFESRPQGAPFLIHACEGVDDLARDEIFALEQCGLLSADTVLIHGLGLDDAGMRLLQARKASLIVCPSSNQFLFHALPAMEAMSAIRDVSLGNDSPLTAVGDLLDEARFAMDACHRSAGEVYRMVTESPARLLRLGKSEGTIRTGGVADVMAVRDDGRDVMDRFGTLSFRDVEFVMVSGEIRLASDDVMQQLPDIIKTGLEPLCVDGCRRWLRAPIQIMLQEAEHYLGKDEVRLGGRSVRCVSLS